jgi:hypothetical protein
MMKVLSAMVIAAALSAQAPPPSGNAAPEAALLAPPEVDLALRARVTQFFQLEVEGKYHQAEQLVAEDTKDLFVGSSKPTYQGFAIESIKYSGDFTKAQVVVWAKRQMPVEGFMGHPLMSKLPSRWRLENGLWCYYVDPKTDMPPTFPGRPGPAAVPVPTVAAPGAAAVPPMLPVRPVPVGPSAGNPHAPPPLAVAPTVPKLLSASKLAVDLKSSAPSSDQVLITNPTPFATVLLLTDPKIKGLAAALDRPTLKPFEKATLSIQWSGGPQIPERPVTITVKSQRTSQVIPITVTFSN